MGIGGRLQSRTCESLTISNAGQLKSRPPARKTDLGSAGANCRCRDLPIVINLSALSEERTAGRCSAWKSRVPARATR